MRSLPVARRLRWASSAGFAFVAACGGRAPVDPWAEAAPRFTLAPEGVIDGPFGAVGPVAVDGRGTVYVADAQLQQVHAFSPQGRLLETIGRRGHGPGEFQRLVDVVAGRGDTVFALDAGAGRITAITPAPGARVAYTLPLPRRSGAVPGGPLLVPRSGAFLVSYSTPYNDAPGHGADRRRDLVRVYADGRADPLPVVREAEAGALVDRLPGGGTMVGALPYGRAPVLRLGVGDRIFHGTGDSAAVAVADLSGRPVATLRWPWQAAPVGRRELRRLLRSLPPAPAEDRARMKQAFGDGRVPRTRPAWTDLLPDDDGGVWVRAVGAGELVVAGEHGLEYTAPRGGDPRAPWWVLTAAGARRGVALVPAGTRLAAVRGGRAYGVQADSLGVQRVVRFRVLPPAASGAVPDHPLSGGRR